MENFLDKVLSEQKREIPIKSETCPTVMLFLQKVVTIDCNLL